MGRKIQVRTNEKGVAGVLIERFDLKSFGRFTNAALHFGDSLGKLHIIYGANESGKSTSLRGITAWLFGIDSRSTDAYTHTYGDLRVGGRLVSTKLGTLECVRRKGVKRTLKSIDESDDVDEKKLSKMLGGMDQETFLHGFGLDRQRLIEGGRDIMCGGGELGQILFSAGVGMRGLNQIVSTLDQQKRAIFLGGGSNPELNKVLGEIKRLKTDLTASSLTATELQNRSRQLQEAKQTVKELASYRFDLENKQARADAYLKALPLVGRRASLKKQLADLGSVPLIDENFRQRRRSAETELRVAEGQQSAAAERMQTLELQLASLHRNERVISFADRIRAISDATAVFEASLAKLPKLKSQAEAMEIAYVELLNKLGKNRDVEIRELVPHEAVRLRIDELSESYARLEQARQANQQAIKSTCEQLAELEDHDFGEDIAEPKELSAALKAYANPQRMVDDLAKANAEAVRLAEKAEMAFSRLSGFRGTLEDAKLVALPLQAEIKSLGDEYAAARHKLFERQEELRRLKGELQELEIRIDELSRESTVPTEEQLKEVRTQRDRSLGEIGLHATEKNVDPVVVKTGFQMVSELVTKADNMVDAMRAAVEIVAKREQATASANRLGRRIADAETLLGEDSKAFEDIDARWKHVWASSRVDAAEPAVMQQWLTLFESFSETVQQQNAIVATVKGLTSQVLEAGRAIQETLNRGETEVIKATESDNLLVLHARAQHELASRQAEYARSVENARDRERLQREWTKLRQTESELQQQMENWQTEWQGIVQSLTDEVNVSPSRLRQLLMLIDNAADKQRTWHECKHQMEESEASGTQLTADASSLLGEVGVEDSSGASVVQQVHGLKRLLDEAIQTEKEYEGISKRIRECEKEMQSFEDKVRENKATLEVLCREVGCLSSDQLPALEQSSTSKRELTQELAQLENSLEILSSGAGLDDFAAQVMECDVNELQQTVEHCRSELQLSQVRWEESQQSVGALQRAYDEMDGSSRAAEVNQEIQALEAKAAKLARQYALLAIQQSVLNRSIEAYRDQNQGPILQRATEFFCKITCGRYQALKPYMDDRNQRILVGIRKEGEKETEVRANLMSEGTADALFLSLRLAGLEAHVKEHGPVPLIMDDVLIQFDDDRCTAALGVLSEVSQQTQVIFFTHHQHLIDLVQHHLPSDSFAVHSLEEF